MSRVRYFVRKAGVGNQNLYAVVRGDEPVLLAGWKRARQLARYLSERQPTDAELTAWLAWGDEDAQAYRKRMRPLTLRYPAICARCGQEIPAGERARWHTKDGTVLHPRQPCPLPPLTNAGGKETQ